MTDAKRAGNGKLGKKAFLFTLGLLLVTLAIFSYSKFVFNESEEEKTLFQAAAVSNRANDLDGSLQKCIRDIFSAESSIKVSSSNDTMIFEEYLPGSAGGFGSAISDLDDFVQMNETNVNLTLDEVSAMPLYILPHGIAYYHNFSNYEIITSAPANLSMQNVMLGYRTTITANENITCSWSYTAGNFSYGLIVISAHESGCTMSRNMDLASGAEITISSQDYPDSAITVTIDTDKIRIKLSDSSTSLYKIKNELLTADIADPALPAGVWLGTGLIRLDFADFDLVKSGGARII